VVGVPGQVVKRTHLHHAGDAPDLDHTSLPDIVGVTLKQLLERVEWLESRLDGHDQKKHIHAPVDDSWDGQDFTI
jgi:serine O-acetyltransferase